jgi:chromosome segregation ATPase
LIKTKRLLNDSLIENDRLREIEKTASTRIREVESQHKTAEEGLQIAERQLVEISAKLERECNRSSGFQVEINKLRAELAEARKAAQNAENAAQAFYDQGFEEASESLRSQLGRECNIHFLKGWVSALERAEVDDNSELYALGREYQPFNLGTPENLE